MKLTDEEFEDLKHLQDTIFKYKELKEGEDKGIILYFSDKSLEFINEGLLNLIEKELDERRKNDKITSKIEQILNQPVTKLEPKSSCKYELPCGKCDLNKELCSYKYGVINNGKVI